MKIELQNKREKLMNLMILRKMRVVRSIHQIENKEEVRMVTQRKGLRKEV